MLIFIFIFFQSAFQWFSRCGLMNFNMQVSDDFKEHFYLNAAIRMANTNEIYVCIYIWHKFFLDINSKECLHQVSSNIS